MVSKTRNVHILVNNQPVTLYGNAPGMKLARLDCSSRPKIIPCFEFRGYSTLCWYLLLLGVAKTVRLVQQGTKS